MGVQEVQDCPERPGRGEEEDDGGEEEEDGWRRGRHRSAWLPRGHPLSQFRRRNYVSQQTRLSSGHAFRRSSSGEFSRGPTPWQPSSHRGSNWNLETNLSCPTSSS